MLDPLVHLRCLCFLHGLDLDVAAPSGGSERRRRVEVRAAEEDDVPGETDATLAAQSEPKADFAKVWKAADKVVYSTTLQAASTFTTRLERSFDPDSVRVMKRWATSDLTVGGPNLAAPRSRAGWSMSVNY